MSMASPPMKEEYGIINEILDRGEEDLDVTAATTNNQATSSNTSKTHESNDSPRASASSHNGLQRAERPYYGNRPKAQTPCRYFYTSQGCKYGPQCKFLHPTQHQRQLTKRLRGEDEEADDEEVRSKKAREDAWKNYEKTAEEELRHDYYIPSYNRERDQLDNAYRRAEAEANAFFERERYDLQRHYETTRNSNLDLGYCRERTNLDRYYKRDCRYRNESYSRERTILESHYRLKEYHTKRSRLAYEVRCGLNDTIPTPEG